MPLKRVPEPELMRSASAALEYAAIDHSAQNQSFAARLAGELRFSGGTLADLGAGDCAIPVEICRLVRRARVTAIELSPAMLKLGRRAIELSGFSERISLLRADAKNTALPGGSFDFVTCCNLVHHIRDPRRLFREAARLLRPGGGILFMDLLRPAGAAALAAQMKNCEGDTPRQRKLLEASLRASLTLEEVRECLPGTGLDGALLRGYGERHWELLRPCAPGRNLRKAGRRV